jgi:hypothetical protein
MMFTATMFGNLLIVHVRVDVVKECRGTCAAARGWKIIDCVTSEKRPEDILKTFENPEHLKLDQNPPYSMLIKYQYWNERL